MLIGKVRLLKCLAEGEEGAEEFHMNDKPTSAHVPTDFIVDIYVTLKVLSSS